MGGERGGGGGKKQDEGGECRWELVEEVKVGEGRKGGGR